MPIDEVRYIRAVDLNRNIATEYDAVTYHFRRPSVRLIVR